MGSSSDSDDYLPLSRLSNHKKQKRFYEEKVTSPRLEKVTPVPEGITNYIGMLERMRSDRTIEECEESNCGYSDHYPETSTSFTQKVMDNQTIKEENHTACPGPSCSRKVFKIELKKYHYSSSDNDWE